jgi:2-dehydropantoate 2-reductase
MASTYGAAKGMSSTDELLVVGTGAMACLFAARLSAAGQRVVMLGSWPEGLAALTEYGVRLLNQQGEVEAYPVRATCEPAECAGVGTAIVLVKSWQTERAANQLKECLADGGLALSLQNGMGNLEVLSYAIGLRRIAAGVTTYGATLVEPGMVRAQEEGEVTLAEREPGRLNELHQMLSAAGLQVKEVSDLRSAQWGKLVVNSAINPVTALLDIPNGELMERPDAWKLVQGLVLETASVASSFKVKLPFIDAIEHVRQVALNTAQNSSSMREDVHRGAPTEIDAINGAVVKFGYQRRLMTPYNLNMWNAVKAKVK